MAGISVIILNYNTPEATREAVRSIFDRRSGDAHTEIILIENGSERQVEVDDELRGHITKRIENDRNLGFAAAVNQGVCAASGDIFLFLNSDMELPEGALRHMEEFLRTHEDIGIVGPRTVYPDGAFQISAGNFPSLWNEFSSCFGLYKYGARSTFLTEREVGDPGEKGYLPVDWVSGGCLMVKKAVTDRIGLLDERFFFGVEDMDFCLRARQDGFLVAYLQTVSVPHLHGLSAGGTRSRFKLEHEASGKTYFFRKHHPQRLFARLAVWAMYRLRISLLGMFGKLK